MTRVTSSFTALILFIAVITSIGAVSANWFYTTVPPSDVYMQTNVMLNDFKYVPDMPAGEVSFLQRMDDILNQRYTTDNVTDARDYLINHTIKEAWETGAAPYVGSMDPNFQEQINELFGDIISEMDVSFILKNQNLNNDAFNEIACYSTSDPLDFAENGYAGIVGVYMTVFAPVVDENRNVIAYELVCDSIYGFCYEVQYNPDHPEVSSFSTDDWRDNIVYWHHEKDTQTMPDDAIGVDGVTPFKYHYESYNSCSYAYEGYPWGATGVWIEGKNASWVLYGKIPYIPWEWEL